MVTGKSVKAPMGCGRFLPCLLSVLPSSVWIIFSRPPLAFLCSYNSLSANSFQPIFPLTFKHFSVSPFGNVYFWDPRNQPGSLRPTEVRASLPRGRPGPDCAAWQTQRLSAALTPAAAFAASLPGLTCVQGPMQRGHRFLSGLLSLFF